MFIQYINYNELPNRVRRVCSTYARNGSFISAIGNRRAHTSAYSCVCRCATVDFTWFQLHWCLTHYILPHYEDVVRPRTTFPFIKFLIYLLFGENSIQIIEWQVVIRICFCKFENEWLVSVIWFVYICIFRKYLTSAKLLV